MSTQRKTQPYDKVVSCVSLELYADTSHEPETLLGDEVGVHSAAVIAGSEEVVDIEAEGDGADCVLCSEVDDGSRWHVLMHDDVLHAIDGLLAVGCCLFYVALIVVVGSCLDGIGNLYELDKVCVVGCLFAFDEKMCVELEAFGGLPGEDEVAADGWGIVVGIDVGGVEVIELVREL